MRKKKTYFRPRPRKKKSKHAPPVRTGPFRRPTAVDQIPPDVGAAFHVLGTGVDRHALVGLAEPMEMLVIHGFTREIEDNYKRYRGRVEDFWRDKPEMVEKAQKLDDILTEIASRR